MFNSLIGSLGWANFFIVLTLLVFVHEFGHYLAARWCGVKVLAFSVGFGPKIVGFFDKAGTEWKLAWLPLGGFVKMLGEMLPVPREKQKQVDDSIAKNDLQFAFHKKPVWKRFIIVAAGPLANFIFAFVLLVIMALSFGIPNQNSEAVAADTTITQVVKPSAAEFAGLKAGDKIRTINKLPMDTPLAVIDFMKKSNGEKITIGILRNGKNESIIVRPSPVGSKDGKTTYRLGISFGGGVAANQNFQPTNIGGAINHGFGQTVALTSQMLNGLKQIITGSMSLNQLGGPVMIAKLSSDVGAAGAYAFLSFMVLLSLNLAIINLFPIPVLDGGHLVLLAIEQVFGKPIPQILQQAMMMVGMVFLILLMLAVTAKDIWQLLLQ